MTSKLMFTDGIGDGGKTMKTPEAVSGIVLNGSPRPRFPKSKPMFKKETTGLEIAWREVSQAKLRCGFGSILGAEGISPEEWNSWQMRLLEVEDEMRAYMKERGLL